MDTSSLKRFYCALVRPCLTYAAPAWFYLLSKQDRKRLEGMQQAATRVILPDASYALRLKILSMQKIEQFLFSRNYTHFIKISNNSNNPLFNCLSFNRP